MHFLKTGENQFKYLTFLTDFLSIVNGQTLSADLKGKQHKIII